MGFSKKINRKSIYYKIHPFFLLAICGLIVRFEINYFLVRFINFVLFSYSVLVILSFIFDYVVCLFKNKH